MRDSATMKSTKTCIECGRRLTRDEIALNKKLVSRDLREFKCLACLSQDFGCEVSDLEIKIAEFKERGCTLFI